MKPVFLSMQAFGPFADLQTINFQELGETPLFLINGPTGAGKSTILDAISFALYGESTGKERDPTSMRCDLSDSDTPTEVVFDFILADHVYRVIRTPAQELTKKKGVGTTSKGPTAIAYRFKNADLTDFVFDEAHEAVELLPLKGVKEVNEWVKELTGLSSEQFRQVMVLPQGQFRKLLLADSDQREQIFSQLFQTNIYKQIEEQLKLQSAQLRSDRKSLSENVAGLLDSVELTETDELVQQLAEVEPKYLDAKKTQETAQKKSLDSVKALQAANDTAKKYTELASLKNGIESLNGQAAEITLLSEQLARAEQANKIMPLQKSLQSAKLILTNEVTQQVDLEHKLKELNERHKLETEHFKLLEPQWLELDTKKQALHDWQRKKQLLSVLIDEQANHNNHTQSLASAEASITQRKLEIDQINQSLAELVKIIKTNAEAFSAIPQLQADFEKFDRLGRLRRSVADTLATVSELKAQETQLRENFNKLIAQRDLDQTNLQITELSWHQGQAVELSQQLKVGEPCMVCGSIEHPQPANLLDVSFATKEQVDQARIVVQSTQTQCSSVESDLKSVQFKMRENEQRVKDLNVDLGEYHERPIEWFREQWKQCQTKLAELSTLEKDQQFHLQKQQQGNERLLKVNAALSDFVIKHDAIKVELSASLARIQEREQEIPIEFRNAKALESKIIELTAHIEKVTQDYQKTSMQLKDTQQQLTAQKSLLENVVERIAKQTDTVEQSEAAWLSSLAGAGFDNEVEFQDFCWSENLLHDQQRIVDEHKTKMADFKSRLSYIEDELKSKEMPKLEALEEQVATAEANQREAAKQLSALSNEFESLKRVSIRLAKIYKQVESIEQEYKVIGTLADVAGGQTGNRVSLQRFVLGVLLDDVLNEASQRLQLMSKGRYRLIRKLDRSKGNKTSGLELEIEDAYSGGRRPANTLSGGESFMAALSLALGLSDVVQSYSGGIKLETLFIDEGFGSLDMESLDLAIQTLIDLRKSGRTIGIISHVSELKEQMSQRIDVIPSDRGSVVSVVHV